MQSLHCLGHNSEKCLRRDVDTCTISTTSTILKRYQYGIDYFNFIGFYTEAVIIRAYCIVDNVLIWNHDYWDFLSCRYRRYRINIWFRMSGFVSWHYGRYHIDIESFMYRLFLVNPSFDIVSMSNHDRYDFPSCWYRIDIKSWSCWLNVCIFYFFHLR